MRSRKVRNEEEEGKDDGEMPERGLERKVEGRRLLRSRVHPVWINYEIGGSPHPQKQHSVYLASAIGYSRKKINYCFSFVYRPIKINAFPYTYL